MYILDTCICIDLMRGKLPGTLKVMESCNPKQFAIPAVAVAELEFGIQKSARPQETRRATERFLAPFAIAPFDERCARAYGAIRNQLRLDGTPIGPNDMMIAATALALQATLVTRNVREFKRVKGLAIEDWEEVDFRSRR
ncbi:type II toxin-antitoxin system tRNA(fMet)-specific endonuclease VapC [Adlercreutzia aquisgranensis]|uniref:type II toxin-antitoxin system tRNA(fMet)-specific endonuclease VapC n=1 Tax=Adlercreutzia aquisgranensis TaxID=2941323 RepID=UPI0020420ED3|nr:PIN domain-containing protein [Adlercreutzia aquisgranensis]